jgi:hypothetical protein
MPQSRCTNVVIPTSDCTLLSSIWEIAQLTVGKQPCKMSDRLSLSV